jgi:hypothetical protein
MKLAATYHTPMVDVNILFRPKLTGHERAFPLAQNCV